MSDPLVNIGTPEFWEKALTKEENGVLWRIVKFAKDETGVWVADWQNIKGENVQQRLLPEYHQSKVQLVEEIHRRNP